MRYAIIAGANKKHVQHYSELVETIEEAKQMQAELKKLYRFVRIYDELQGKEVSIWK